MQLWLALPVLSAHSRCLRYVHVVFNCNVSSKIELQEGWQINDLSGQRTD